MKFLTLGLCLVAFSTYSQKSKRFDLVRLQFSSVSVRIDFDEKNTPIDTTFLMLGKDYRYIHLNEFIVLYHGSIQDLYRLMKKCDEFFIEDKGTSMEVGESTLYMDKIMGVRALNLYGVGDDSGGYTVLNKSQIKKVLSKLEDYMTKNHIKQ